MLVSYTRIMLMHYVNDMLLSIIFGAVKHEAKQPGSLKPITFREHHKHLMLTNKYG